MARRRTTETSEKPSDPRIKALQEHLFSDPGDRNGRTAVPAAGTASGPPRAARHHVYALLDGASVDGLLGRLGGDRPEYVCLYRGELEPDIAEVAPYLVRLEPDAPFTQWLLEKGWGGHWGIFAISRGVLRELRQHFRRFTMVRDPDGKQLYFRFYDPRVLRVFLPTCTPNELAEFFGPVMCYALEDEDPKRMLRFWNKPEGLKREEVSAAEA